MERFATRLCHKKSQPLKEQERYKHNKKVDSTNKLIYIYVRTNKRLKFAFAKY